MTADLRDRMQAIEPPEADAAEARAWELVEAAHAERAATGRAGVRSSGAAGRRRRRGLRVAVAVAVLAATIATAFTPAGAAVGDWVRDVIRFGREDARPAIGPLPTAGRLLVTSASGAWVVQRDGASRRLGAFTDVDWSPRGLYVVGVRGRRLVAMEPDGTVHWTLSAASPVRRPAWSPGDGFRIAYLSGGGVRVVAGNGTGDHLLDGTAANVRPAWRPRSDRYELAYARPGGRIVLADADGARPSRRSAQAIAPTALEWTPSGRRLVAMAPGYVWVLDPALRNRGRTAMPTGTTARAMAVHPGGRRVAVIRATPGGRSEIVSIPLKGPGGERTLFAGAGTFTDLAWSPDGRWLLVAWREADQWLFIRSDRVRRVDAAKGIRRHFDPGGDGAGSFPRLGGWCCPGG